jgi:AcrR family transcriptional regulator
MTRKRAALGGRPPATSHAEIEAAAFALFAQKGFDATTMEDIATAVGVGRRTLFRYFPSKNDIPWGQFDDSLEHLRIETEFAEIHCTSFSMAASRHCDAATSKPCERQSGGEGLSTLRRVIRAFRFDRSKTD